MTDTARARVRGELLLAAGYVLTGPDRWHVGTETRKH